MVDTDTDTTMLKEEIESLKQQLKEAQENDDFSELKTQYDTALQNKDMEIQSLKDKLAETEAKVDETIENLTDEAKEKLEVQEKLKEFSDYIAELEKDKAESLVETFINQGKITPKQKDTAFKMAVNDYDGFYELYKDAKPVIELEPSTRKINVNNDGLRDYFKDI